MNRLTLKQKRFVAEYVKTGNATRSALATYDTVDSNTAHAIGSQNLRKLTIQKSIQESLEAEGYAPEESIQRLRKNASMGVGVKVTAGDSIRSDELLLKMAGHMVNRQQNVSINVDIHKMGKDQLMKMKKRYDKLLQLTS